MSRESNLRCVVIALLAALFSLATGFLVYVTAAHVEAKNYEPQPPVIAEAPALAAETVDPAIYDKPAEPMILLRDIGEYKLTAYCSCEKCCGEWANNRPLDEAGRPIVTTASGAQAVEGVTVAVDPDVIPYGTELLINEHTYIAQDTGAACRRGQLIDIYFESHEAALQFGVQHGTVYIINYIY